MTKEELIKTHKDGSRLVGDLILAKVSGQITTLEYQHMMNNVERSLNLLAEKINSMDIITIEYSIEKCDCCEEEFILETHTNHKGEIVEQKPFDFTMASPVEIFKMGFDTCLKEG